MSQDYSMFGYWTNGSNYVELNPDPPTPEEARPFVVEVRGGNWIPISVLVFARDAEQAWHRVEISLQEMAASTYIDSCGDPPRSTKTARRILNELATSAMQKLVRPFDITRMSAKVNWASNGGI